MKIACLWRWVNVVSARQRVDDILFLLHVLLALFKPVAIAFDVDDGAVMQHPVEDGGGDRNLREDLIPLEKVLFEVKIVEAFS